MIVVSTDGQLRLIEQEHHAHLTGTLAARMPFGVLDHAAFVAAARVHDNGWREADATPTVDSDGKPHTFSSAPDKIYEAVWRRGIDRASRLDALVGLLVSLHGSRFFAPRTSAGMRLLAKETERRHTELLQQLGYGRFNDQLPDDVRQASDRIAFLDAVSLMLCGTLPDELTASMDGTEYTLSRAGSTVTVTPWPFTTGAADLNVAVRYISDRVYDGHVQLREAVAAAASETLSVRIQ